MESHYRHPNKSSASLPKKAFSNGNGGFSYGSSGKVAAANNTTTYDDVFGGPPKFGAPTLSPRLEDYCEIFAGFNGSSRAAAVSSIPVLDLPLVDDRDLFFDVRDQGFDYREVFGGFNDHDFAPSYEELFMQRSTAGDDSDSSDGAWTPEEVESFSGGTEHSGKSPSFSNGRDSYDSIDGSTEFNISYNKASRISGEPNVSGGVIRVADLGYTVAVDEMTSVGGAMPLGSEPFVTVSEIGLKTNPTGIPPPSRPPPLLKTGFKKSGSNSRTTGSDCGSSPRFYDVEVDASSAAVREAMVKAEAKLKGAKEMLERKRESAKQTSMKSRISEEGLSSHRAENKIDIGRNSLRDKDGSKSLSSQGSTNTNDEWEEATQFVELVRTEQPRNADENSEGIDVSLPHNADFFDQKLTWAGDVDWEKQRRRAQGDRVGHEAKKLPKHNGTRKVSSRLKRHDDKLAEKAPEEQRSRHVELEFELGNGLQHHGEIVDKRNLPRQEENKLLTEKLPKQKKESHFEEKTKRVENQQSDRIPHQRAALKNKECVFNWDQNARKLREALGLADDESTLEISLEGKGNGKSLGSRGETDESETKLKEALRRMEEDTRIKEALAKEENDRREREAFEKAENERKLKAALEQEEKEKKMREAREKDEIKRRAAAAAEQERKMKEQQELELRRREAFEKEEMNRKTREAREKVEQERKMKEQQELELRRREAFEKEEMNRRMREAREKAEQERKMKEQQELELRRKEAFEKEEMNRKMREAHEKAEHERKMKVALEQEKERKIKEAREKEENERRIKEAREKAELEQRLKEEEERRIKEIQEKEENERRERAENERKVKEALEKKEKERMVKEAREKEENEKKLKEAIELEEKEKRLIEAFERAETERRLKEDLEQAEMKMKLQEAKERERIQRENQERDVCEMEKPCETTREEERVDNQKSVNKPKEEEEDEDEGPNHRESMSEEACPWKVFEKNLKDASQKEGTSELDAESRLFESNEEAPQLDSNGELSEESVSVPDNVQGGKLEQKSQNFESSKVASVLKRDVGMKPEVESDIGVGRNQEESKISSGFRSHEDKFTRQPERGSNYETQVGSNQDAKLERPLPSQVFVQREKEAERLKRERDFETERLRKLEEEREREREREKDRMAFDQRALADARERLEKACAEAREKSLPDKSSIEARLRAERAAVERATAEARERAAEKAARERMERSVSDMQFQSTGFIRERMERSVSDKQFQNSASFGSSRLGTDGESPQRYTSRLERHRRTADRVAKALAEKNMRDLVAQREQAERMRIAETLDAEVKRWSNGKEGNIRALLSTLQYILGPESGWQSIPLTEVITSAAVKRAYRKATLCVHPDKLQQRGANTHQKYICEKVFDLLKEAWNRFNSEER